MSGLSTLVSLGVPEALQATQPARRRLPNHLTFIALIAAHSHSCSMPLRPAVKLLSAVFRGLPPFSRATGDGMRALPTLTAGAASAGTPSMITYGAGSGSSHWGGASSAINGGATEGRAGGAAAGGTNDPVAERRRERALRALDKKLAEMRVGMSSRGGGAPVTPGPALIPMPPTPVDGAGAGAAAPATPVNV